VLPLALKAWRKERGWSQKKLAALAGVSPTLIALIETEERQPSRLNAEAIAAALGVDVGVLAILHTNGAAA
jgi:transcriptional regulator with XRE-family HTH domain